MHAKAARKLNTAPSDLKLDTVAVDYLKKSLAELQTDQSATAKSAPEGVREPPL